MAMTSQDPRCRRAFLRPGLWLTAVAVAAVVLAGCNFGPSTIPRDRLDYADAVSTSTKRQNGSPVLVIWPRRSQPGPPELCSDGVSPT